MKTDVLEVRENQIQEYSKTEAALAELKERYGNAVFDVSITKGLALAREARAEIRAWRTGLEKERVKIKKPALSYCKRIDSEAKRITAELEKLEEPIDQTIKEEEGRKEKERLAKVEAETKRIAEIQARIDIIRNIPLHLQGKNAALIKEVLDSARDTVIGEEYEEFTEVAMGAKARAVEALETLYTETVAKEEEQAKILAEREELKKLKAEQEKRDKEAEAKRIEEEAKTKKAEYKLKQEREAHEKKIKAEQEKADKERAEIARKQAELDKRKAEQEEAERLLAERTKRLAEAKKDSQATALVEIWKLAEDIFRNPNHQAVRAEIGIIAEANL